MLTGLIIAWCVVVFVMVPTGPNPYAPNQRWWLAYALFGGRRGAMMLGGILLLCFVYGLLMGKGR